MDIAADIAHESRNGIRASIRVSIDPSMFPTGHPAMESKPCLSGRDGCWPSWSLPPIRLH